MSTRSSLKVSGLPENLTAEIDVAAVALIARVQKRTFAPGHRPMIGERRRLEINESRYRTNVGRHARRNFFRRRRRVFE